MPWRLQRVTKLFGGTFPFELHTSTAASRLHPGARRAILHGIQLTGGHKPGLWGYRNSSASPGISTKSCVVLSPMLAPPNNLHPAAQAPKLALCRGEKAFSLTATVYPCFGAYSALNLAANSPAMSIYSKALFLREGGFGNASAPASCPKIQDRLHI